MPSKISESETEGRKWSKPIMEKRRRQRINRSLDELKRLVLEAQNRDSSRYTKLEKADILEMTVEHLRELRSRQKSVSAAGTMTCQNVISAGVNVSGWSSVTKGQCDIRNHVVMETRQTSQTMSHLIGNPINTQGSIDINKDRSGPNAAARDRNLTSSPFAFDCFGVGQSTTCQPLHISTAVQLIPMCSSSMQDNHGCFPRREQFWRPF